MTSNQTFAALHTDPEEEKRRRRAMKLDPEQLAQLDIKAQPEKRSSMSDVTVGQFIKRGLQLAHGATPEHRRDYRETLEALMNVPKLRREDMGSSMTKFAQEWDTAIARRNGKADGLREQMESMESQYEAAMAEQLASREDIVGSLSPGFKPGADDFPALTGDGPKFDRIAAADTAADEFKKRMLIARSEFGRFNIGNGFKDGDREIHTLTHDKSFGAGIPFMEDHDSGRYYLPANVANATLGQLLTNKDGSPRMDVTVNRQLLSGEIETDKRGSFITSEIGRTDLKDLDTFRANKDSIRRSFLGYGGESGLGEAQQGGIAAWMADEGSNWLAKQLYNFELDGYAYNTKTASPEVTLPYLPDLFGDGDLDRSFRALQTPAGLRSMLQVVEELKENGELRPTMGEVGSNMLTSLGEFFAVNAGFKKVMQGMGAVAGKAGKLRDTKRWGEQATFLGRTGERLGALLGRYKESRWYGTHFDLRNVGEEVIYGVTKNAITGNGTALGGAAEGVFEGVMEGVAFAGWRGTRWAGGLASTKLTRGRMPSISDLHRRGSAGSMLGQLADRIPNLPSGRVDLQRIVHGMDTSGVLWGHVSHTMDAVAVGGIFGAYQGAVAENGEAWEAMNWFEKGVSVAENLTSPEALGNAVAYAGISTTYGGADMLGRRLSKLNPEQLQRLNIIAHQGVQSAYSANSLEPTAAAIQKLEELRASNPEIVGNIEARSRNETTSPGEVARLIDDLEGGKDWLVTNPEARAAGWEAARKSDKSEYRILDAEEEAQNNHRLWVKGGRDHAVKLVHRDGYFGFAVVDKANPNEITPDTSIYDRADGAMIEADRLWMEAEAKKASDHVGQHIEDDFDYGPDGPPEGGSPLGPKPGDPAGPAPVQHQATLDEPTLPNERDEPYRGQLGFKPGEAVPQRGTGLELGNDPATGKPYPASRTLDPNAPAPAKSRHQATIDEPKLPNDRADPYRGKQLGHPNTNGEHDHPTKAEAQATIDGHVHDPELAGLAPAEKVKRVTEKKAQTKKAIQKKAATKKKAKVELAALKEELKALKDSGLPKKELAKKAKALRRRIDNKRAQATGKPKTARKVTDPTQSKRAQSPVTVIDHIIALGGIDLRGEAGSGLDFYDRLNMKGAKSRLPAGLLYGPNSKANAKGRSVDAMAQALAESGFEVEGFETGSPTVDFDTMLEWIEEELGGNPHYHPAEAERIYSDQQALAEIEREEIELAMAQEQGFETIEEAIAFHANSIPPDPIEADGIWMPGQEYLPPGWDEPGYDGGSIEASQAIIDERTSFDEGPAGDLQRQYIKPVNDPTQPAEGEDVTIAKMPFRPKPTLFGDVHKDYEGPEGGVKTSETQNPLFELGQKDDLEGQGVMFDPGAGRVDTIDFDKAPPLVGFTAAFAQRFQGSKVVDTSGQPLPVYHGTGSRFRDMNSARTSAHKSLARLEKIGETLSRETDSYKASYPGELARARARVEELGPIDNESFDTDVYGANDEGYLAAGSYFSESPELASEYAEITTGRDGPQVRQVYLSIRHPYERGVDAKVDAQVEAAASEAAGAGRDVEDIRRRIALAKRDKLKELGFDGQVDRDGTSRTKATEWVAFDPSQIISATGDPSVRPTSRTSALEASAINSPATTLALAGDATTKAMRLLEQIEWAAPDDDSKYLANTIYSVSTMSETDLVDVFVESNVFEDEADATSAARETLQAAKAAVSFTQQAVFAMADPGIARMARAYWNAKEDVAKDSRGWISDEVQAELKALDMLDERGRVKPASADFLNKWFNEKMRTGHNGESVYFESDAFYSLGGMVPFHLTGLADPAVDGNEFAASRLFRATHTSKSFRAGLPKWAWKFMDMTLGKYQRIAGRFYSGAYLTDKARKSNASALGIGSRRQAQFAEWRYRTAEALGDINLPIGPELVTDQMLADYVDIVDSGAFKRIKSEDDFARQFGEGYRHMWNSQIKITEVSNAIGQELVDLGVMAKAQFDKHKSQYVMHAYLRDAQRRRYELLKAGDYGGMIAGRNLSRSKSGEHQQSIRINHPSVFETAHNQEAKGVMFAGTLTDILAQGVAIPFDEIAKLPPSEQVLWEVAVGADAGDYATHDPLNGRKLTKRQKQLHDILSDMRDGMQTVKEAADQVSQRGKRQLRPYTFEGRTMLDSYLGIRDPKNVHEWLQKPVAVTPEVGQMVEMIANRTFGTPNPDSTLAFYASRFADTLRSWRRNMTIMNPKHWVLARVSDITTNFESGTVGIVDFVSSMLLGKGSYHDAMAGANKLHELTKLGFPETQPEGWSNEDWQQAQEARDLSNYWFGATYTQQLLESGTLGDYFGEGGDPQALNKFMRGQIHNRLDGTLEEKMIRATDEFTKRMQPGIMAREKKRIERWDSRHADQKAQAVMDWTAEYQTWEFFAKYAAFINLKKKNPGLGFDEVARRAAQGTADYRDTSIAMQEFSTNFNIFDANAGSGSNAAKAGVRMLFGTPFMLYNAAMVPRKMRNIAARPLQVATSVAISSLLNEAIWGDTDDEDRDAWMRSRAGSQGSPGMPLITKEDKDILTANLPGMEMPWVLGGGALNSSQRKGLWGLMLHALTLSPGEFRAPSRRGDTRVGEMTDMMGSASVAVGAARKLRDYPEMTNAAKAQDFYRALEGWIPSIAGATLQGVLDLYNAPGGQAKMEVGFEHALRLVGQMSPALGPTPASFLSRPGQHAFEGLVLGQQKIGDYLRGNIAISTDSKEDALKEVLFSTMFRSRAVRPRAAYENEASFISNLISQALPEIAPKSQAEMRRKRTAKVVTDQVQEIIRSEYHEFRSFGRVPGEIRADLHRTGQLDSFDARLAVHLNLGADIIEGSDPPILKAKADLTTTIGRRIAKLDTASQAYALEYATKFIPKSLEGSAHETILDGARMRQLEPDELIAYWRASLYNDSGRALLSHIHKELIGRGNRSNIENQYDLFMHGVSIPKSGDIEGLKWHRELMLKFNPMQRGPAEGKSGIKHALPRRGPLGTLVPEKVFGTTINPKVGVDAKPTRSSREGARRTFSDISRGEQ